MTSFNHFIESNSKFYNSSDRTSQDNAIVFLASKDIHMSALTMRFSKAAAEVVNSDLIVVPNITFPKNIFKMLISFKPSHIVKKEIHMVKIFFIKIFFLIKIFLDLKDGEDLVKIKIEDVEVGKHLYDYLLAKYKLSTINKLNLKLKIMALIDIVYYLSSIKLISKYDYPLIILPDNAYRHGMIFEYAKQKELKCLAGLSMTAFTAHKYDSKESYSFHCRTPSKKLVNSIKHNPHSIKKAKDSYLKRISGDGDQHDVVRAFSLNKINISRNKLINIMSLDPDKPIVLVASHIFRDAPHAYPNTIFKDYEIWLKETCLELSKNEEINFVIKEHPSYKLYNEEGVIENILDEVGCKDALLPKNIRTNTLYDSIDCLITCGGTAGMEFAYNGTPVILGASPPYSGFGFTINSSTREDYIKNIKEVQNFKKLNQDQRNTALTTLFIINDLMQANNLSYVIGSQKVYLGTKLDFKSFYRQMAEDCIEGRGFNSLKADISEVIFSDSRNIKRPL